MWQRPGAGGWWWLGWWLVADGWWLADGARGKVFGFDIVSFEGLCRSIWTYTGHLKELYVELRRALKRGT